MENDADWPFDSWLKIAVMQMGLSPQMFWQMSVRDWFALTQSATPKPMTQKDLIKLEQYYEQHR